MKIKNKIISIIVIIATLINISSISKAVLVGKQIEVRIVETNLPYSYNNEERNTVLRFTDNNMPVYVMKKNDEKNTFTANNIEFYNNTEIKNILKNGYGCKTLDELEINNIEEAYLATQEAIYIKKERRNIDYYDITKGEEEKANRILNLTRKILNNASNEKPDTVEVDRNDTKWKTYEKDNNYKYKEYTIHSANTIPGDIIVQQGDDVRIIDKLTNETKNMFNDGDTFYLIVPKDKEQEIQIQFGYERKDAYLYIYKKTEALEDQYLLAEKELFISSAMFIEEVEIENNVEILNEDQETKLPIVGNVFSIVKEDGTVVKNNLVTNAEGKISINLSEGKYYLKQTNAIDGYNLNKALIELEVESEGNIKTKIESMKTSTKEITTVNKEINVIEENKNIIENNITEVSNIKTTNINKQIINEINETNLHNVNNFIDTINRKNVTNLTKKNIYNNYKDELYIQNRELEGEQKTLNMTRRDYVNYIDMVMLDSAKVPILPVASK